MTTLLLASQSPRRRRLIKLLGLPVITVDVDVDESQVTLPDPAQNVVETAVLKARAAHEKLALEPGDGFIIGSDTTVAYAGEMLGKPADAAEAKAMLTRLRGRRHQVHTGLAVIDRRDGRCLTDVASVDVPMRPYSETEVDAYIATGDPLDKAGGYAIQHPDFRPVTAFADCYAAVVGLPLCHLARTLRRLGVTPPADVPGGCQQALDYACPVWPRILSAGDR